jgi:hypothetical protein
VLAAAFYSLLATNIMINQTSSTVRLPKRFLTTQLMERRKKHQPTLGLAGPHIFSSTAMTAPHHDYSSSSSTSPSVGEPFLGCAGGAPWCLRIWTITGSTVQSADAPEDEG